MCTPYLKRKTLRGQKNMECTRDCAASNLKRENYKALEDIVEP